MRTLLTAACCGALAASAGAQAVHHGYVWLEGPDGALEPDTTYTIEAWARWESPLFVQGLSAMGGFGVDVINTTGANTTVIAVENVRFPAWAAQYASLGGIIGTDLHGVSGGQGPSNPFNPVITDFDLSNPILLFTFDFTTADTGIDGIVFRPMHPNPNGGLSFYPSWAEGVTIVAPNHPDTGSHFSGWEYWVPSPGGGALAVGLCFIARRRR